MINVAVVGMGWWGKTVVNLIQKSSKLRVVAGMNLNAKLDEDFAREHGFHMVSDYAQVLADPRVEAVILCTPHSLHKDQ
ncbi:MAG: Gfo/Idh/MocA family oxidoreductase, partial [Betaproteobacteria bacterium]